MRYFAEVKVVTKSGTVVADCKMGPYLSYQYAAGIAHSKVNDLWADLCLHEEGLTYQTSVTFEDSAKEG